MAGDISGLAADIEAECLALWAATVSALSVFANSSLRQAIRGANMPGPDTKALDSAIFSEGHSMGQWSYWAGTTILDVANPKTGHSTADYGYYWNYGHVNPFMGWTYQPARMFMETGSDIAYAALDGVLLGLGWMRG